MQKLDILVVDIILRAGSDNPRRSWEGKGKFIELEVPFWTNLQPSVFNNKNSKKWRQIQIYSIENTRL